MNKREIIDRFYTYVQSKDVVLLRKKEVIQWLLNDTSFLSEQENQTKEQYKILEDEWGRSIMKARRPDLNFKKQWTNLFGEYVTEELFTLLGHNVRRARHLQRFRPDLEIDESILEVKTGTYFTDGTAYEKIPGTPFKYSAIPTLYDKPLKIICIGGAEQASILSGVLPGPNQTDEKREFLNFYREKRIEFVAITDLIISIIQ